VTDLDGAELGERTTEGWIPVLDGSYPVPFVEGGPAGAFDVDDLGRPVFVSVDDTGRLAYRWLDDLGLVAGFTRLAPVFPGRVARAPAIALRNFDTIAAPQHWWTHCAWIERGDDGEALLLESLRR
jgi:hypothetical protein